MSRSITLLIRDRRGPGALICARPTRSGGLALPRAPVALSTGTPLSIEIEAAEAAMTRGFPGWGLRFVRHLRETPASDGVPASDVIEAAPSSSGVPSALPPTLRWVAPEALGAALAEDCRGLLDSPAPRPWLERGYVEGEVMPWLSRQLGARPASVDRLRASARSLVLRVEAADGRRVWFKADGAPEPSEARVLQALAPIAGDALPPAMASDPERGWLLRADFQATLLEALPDTAPWAAAAGVLGRLQRRSEGEEDRFEGLRDYRGHKLRAALLAMLGGRGSGRGAAGGVRCLSEAQGALRGSALAGRDHLDGAVPHASSTGGRSGGRGAGGGGLAQPFLTRGRVRIGM